MASVTVAPNLAANFDFVDHSSGAVMRLDPKEEIAGFPILAVRNALRRCGPWFDTEDLARLLKASPKAIESFMAELVRRGWCEPHARGGWEITTIGMSFLNASGGPPISRAKASLQLQVLIERAENFHVNFPNWPARLEEVAVFGSYLTGVDTLGDLDVALRLEKLPALMNREAVGWARVIAEKSGYRIRSKLDLAGGFLTGFIADTLKKGLRSVHLHDWFDPQSLECRYEVVWTQNVHGITS
jgi:hypothetical protein